jgi:hypothetical protein
MAVGKVHVHLLRVAEVAVTLVARAGKIGLGVEKLVGKNLRRDPAADRGEASDF